MGLHGAAEIIVIMPRNVTSNGVEAHIAGDGLFGVCFDVRGRASGVRMNVDGCLNREDSEGEVEFSQFEMRTARKLRTRSKDFK